MEMYFFDRLAVCLGFRLGHDAEYLQCELAGTRRQFAAVQNGGHIRQIAVLVRMMMAMPVMVFMVVVMFVMMRMFMSFVRMLVFERFLLEMMFMPMLVVVMLMLVFQLDIEGAGVDAM